MGLSVLDLLLPRETAFFDYMNEQAEVFCQACKEFKRMTVDIEHLDPDQMRRRVSAIKEYELKGDEVERTIIDKLDTTFITPLDREDIQRMGTRLDDVLDAMDAAANRMMLYDVGRPTEDAKAFARVLVKATGLLAEGFGLLRDLKKPEMLLSTCVEVHTQENEGDRLLHTALANLF